MKVGGLINCNKDNCNKDAKMFKFCSIAPWVYFFTTLIAGEDSNFEMEIVREVVIDRKKFWFCFLGQNHSP